MRLWPGPIAWAWGNQRRWQFVIKKASLHSILFRWAVQTFRRPFCSPPKPREPEASSPISSASSSHFRPSVPGRGGLGWRWGWGAGVGVGVVGWGRRRAVLKTLRCPKKKERWKLSSYSPHPPPIPHPLLLSLLLSDHFSQFAQPRASPPIRYSSNTECGKHHLNCTFLLQLLTRCSLKFCKETLGLLKLHNNSKQTKNNSFGHFISNVTLDSSIGAKFSCQEGWGGGGVWNKILRWWGFVVLVVQMTIL